MSEQSKGIFALMWVVLTDSLGWGIAFSVFAALFLSAHSSILDASVSDATRYMVYELLLAIYSVFMFFFAPILGGIADYYGRKPGLKISMIGLTFGFLLNATGCYFENIWFLVIGRVISGATAGSFSIAQAAAIDLSTPKNKSFYLSLLMVTNTLGFSLGPVLGGVFIEIGSAYAGTITFIVAALMGVIGYFSIVLLFKETYQRPSDALPFKGFSDFGNIKIAFSRPILGSYLYSLLFAMVAFGLFFSNIPVFLSRIFSSNSAITGSILSAEAIIFSITMMFAGKFLFRLFSKETVAKSAEWAQLLAYIVMAFVLSSFAANIALFTWVSCFAGIMYISLITLISDVTSPDWQGRVMGVVAALSAVTWGVGPILTGILNQYGVGLAYLICALLTFLGVGAFASLSIKLKCSPTRKKLI